MKKYRVGLFFLLTASLLFGCPKKKGDSETPPEELRTLDKIRERGVLKVGFSQFNPWAMLNPQGTWIGFEIDVAAKLAEDLGVELELVPTKWAGIIPALLTNKFDLIIGGLTVTKERAEKVTFSDPYEYVKQTLLLAKRLEDKNLDRESLNRAEYRFSVRAGSTPVSIIEELFPKVQVRAFDDEVLAYQDVLNGQADGFIGATPLPADLMAKYPDKLFIPDWGTELRRESVAFGLPKNAETEWLEHLNAWIKANWDNGFLEEKARYWFESVEWKSLIPDS